MVVHILPVSFLNVVPDIQCFSALTSPIVILIVSVTRDLCLYIGQVMLRFLLEMTLLALSDVILGSLSQDFNLQGIGDDALSFC